jgi:sec-independent protein translocase protein TatA
MFGDIIQPTHLLFILVVALLVLGPKRLPEVGRSLGKGIRDFRGAISGLEEHTTGLLRDEPPAPVATTPAEAVPVATPAPVTATATVAAEPEPADYSD